MEEGEDEEDEEERGSRNAILGSANVAQSLKDAPYRVMPPGSPVVHATNLRVTPPRMLSSGTREVSSGEEPERRLTDAGAVPLEQVAQDMISEGKALQSILAENRQLVRTELKPSIRVKKSKLHEFKTSLRSHFSSAEEHVKNLRCREEALEKEGRQMKRLSADLVTEEKHLINSQEEKAAESDAYEQRIQVLMDRLVILLSDNGQDSTSTMRVDLMQEFSQQHSNLEKQIQVFKERLEEARRENREVAVRLSEEQAHTKRLHDKLCERQGKLYGQRQQRSYERFDVEGASCEPRKQQQELRLLARIGEMEVEARNQAVSSTAVVSPPVAAEPAIPLSPGAGMDETLNATTSRSPSPLRACWSPGSARAVPRSPRSPISPRSPGSPWNGARNAPGSPVGRRSTQGSANRQALQQRPWKQEHGFTESSSPSNGGALTDSLGAQRTDLEKQAKIEERLKKVLDMESFHGNVMRMDRGLYKFGDEYSYVKLSPEGEVWASLAVSHDDINPLSRDTEWLPIEEFVADLCAKRRRHRTSRSRDSEASLPSAPTLPATPQRPPTKAEEGSASTGLAGDDVHTPGTLHRSREEPRLDSPNQGDDAAGRACIAAAGPPHVTAGDDAAGREPSLGSNSPSQSVSRDRLKSGGSSAASLGGDAAGGWHRSRTAETKGAAANAGMAALSTKQLPEPILARPASMGDSVTASASSIKPSSLADGSSGSFCAPPCLLKGATTAPRSGTPIGAPPTNSVGLPPGSSKGSVTIPTADSFPPSPQPSARLMNSVMSVSGMLSPGRVCAPTMSAGKPGSKSPPRIANKANDSLSPQAARYSPSTRAEAPPPVSRLSSRPGTPFQNAGSLSSRPGTPLQGTGTQNAGSLSSRPGTPLQGTGTQNAGSLSSRPGTPLQGTGTPSSFAPPLRSPSNGRNVQPTLVTPRAMNSPRTASGTAMNPAVSSSPGAALSVPLGSIPMLPGGGQGSPRPAAVARGGSITQTIGARRQISGADGGSLELPSGLPLGASAPMRSMSTSPPPRPRSPVPVAPMSARSGTPGRVVKAPAMPGSASQAWK